MKSSGRATTEISLLESCLNQISKRIQHTKHLSVLPSRLANRLFAQSLLSIDPPELWVPLARLLVAENLKITKIDLRGCKVGERSLNALTCLAPRIRHLAFHECIFTSDVSTKSVSSFASAFQNIISFALINCNISTCSSFILIISQAWSQKLTHLSISACQNTPLSLSKVDFRNLYYFSIESIDSSSSLSMDDLCRIICTNSSTLIALSLRGIVRSDERRRDLFLENPLLIKTNIRFPNLRYLDLGGCKPSTSLLRLLRNRMPNLSFVEMEKQSSSTLMIDDSLLKLIFPNLISIKFSFDSDWIFCQDEELFPLLPSLIKEMLSSGGRISSLWTDYGGSSIPLPHSNHNRKRKLSD